MRVLPLALGLLAATLECARAQSSSSGVVYNTSAITTTTATTTFTTLTTSTFTTTSVTRSNGNELTVSVPATTTFNETVTATTTATITPTATPIQLDTVVDPGFAVLGVVLVISGLPSAFWGHKNRWSSFFVIGFYSLALVTFVLILKYGVLPAVNPPDETLRGMFVLACTIAGIAGGGVAIFFWRATKYFVGAWGGLVFGLWIQCFKNGGLIHEVGFRWLMYIACAAVGFALCTIPKLHYPSLLVSTAFVGSTSFVLGIDCFTTAGLKEFYMWNIGFTALFPKYVKNDIKFPVTQTMTIELGLIAAIALMGGAVQLRVLVVLKRKLAEMENDRRRREADLEREHTDRYAHVEKEREEWEKMHGKGFPGRHERLQSGLSGMPLLNDQEGGEAGAVTPATTPGPFDTPNTMVEGRPSSTFTEDMLGPAVAHRRTQSSGALPALDLGLGIEDDVPKDFISSSPNLLSNSPSTSPAPGTGRGPYVADELRKKEELLEEIQSIRRSIDVLRTASPGPSLLLQEGQPRSRYTSFASMDAAAQLRPPSTSTGMARSRIQSMDLTQFQGENSAAGASIGRPTSVPLRDSTQEQWDAYVRDRTLFTPPSGVTSPIPTSAPLAAPQPRRSSFMSVPAAVTEALMKRSARESSYELGELGGSGSERGGDGSLRRTPDAQLFPQSQRHARDSSVNILPPRRDDGAGQRERERPRTKTFEELAERHREKMRSMQAPLTEKEKERKQIEDARTRYERSKEVERQVQAKKEAAQQQQQQAGRRSGDERRRSVVLDSAVEDGASGSAAARPRPRSMSADRLTAMGTGASGPASKRTSIMKVEDWQQYQQTKQPASASARQPGRDDPRRSSRNVSPGPGVPFPAPPAGQSQGRRARHQSNDSPV